MMIKTRHITTLPKAAYLTIAGMLLACTLHAVEYDSIAVKYKNEHAVIINYYRHLVIAKEDGKLTATSYITKEKMLISDRSPALYNTDYLYHSDFNKLIDLSAT